MPAKAPLQQPAPINRRELVALIILAAGGLATVLFCWFLVAMIAWMGAGA